MSEIVIAIVVLAIIGLIIGIALVAAGRKFHVDVDERETAVRDVLPGNNCGACGYAGCDAMAAAIAKGEAPVNGCPVGGAPVAAKIAEIMGTTADETVKKAAYIHCAGDLSATKPVGRYVGLTDCRAVYDAGLHLWSCDSGCMGLGSCVRVCPQNAISVKDGLAVVNQEKCVACGLCVKECPQKLIELLPVKKICAVACSSCDKGAAVRKNCSAGCIGCHLCEKQCKFDAVHVVNNLAKIDPDKCVGCGACMRKCPAKVIHYVKA